MKLTSLSRIYVFILTFLVWIFITSFTDVQEIVAGLVIALFVSYISGGILLKTGKSVIVEKAFFFFLYILLLFWEMLKANLHVAMIVINPNLPIKPGIVKIHTDLKEDSSITVLANSITLTPGTLTVDVDKDESSLYIHWITVESYDVEGCTKEIGGRFEPVIRRFMR